MTSLGHYFKDGHTLEEKLGLAAASYELVQAIPRVAKYLEKVGWESMIKHEVELQETLLQYLRNKKGVVILGEPGSETEKRVPVISFTVKGRSAQSVVEHIEKKDGNFGESRSLSLLP